MPPHEDPDVDIGVPIAGGGESTNEDQREPLRSDGRWRARMRFVLRAGLAAAGLSVLAFVVVLASIWLWWLRDPSASQHSRGVNALWAAHTWVGDPHSDSEYQQFAALLSRNEISDLMAHAGPLEADGSVPNDRTAHAGEFLAAMHRYAPQVRVQAYLGQIEERGGGPLDLDDPSVRDHVVETAGRLLDMGFGGIHYDIEPIFPGDESFPSLLVRTHELTAQHGAVLSVAMEQPEPVPGAQRVISFFVGGYHDPTIGYLRAVAARTDQVAIMAYDTGLPTDWLFGADIAWQTERVVGAIGDDVTVFMGVPTYDKGAFMQFHSSAENMESAVRGVRKGLDRMSSERTQHVGLAIFAEWTTTDDEWDTYSKEWLGY